MSTRIRLRRMGSNKRPFYRVVVADQRSPRDGRFIEIIGKYHPLSEPSVIEIDEVRALHWLMVGAQPSNQVRNLMSKVGIWDKFVAERPGAAVAATPKDGRPTRTKMSKKAQAKAAEAATATEESRAEPAEEAPTPELPHDEPAEAAPEVEGALEAAAEPEEESAVGPDSPPEQVAQEPSEG
jgi:small subunit ribosomal protein S16